MGIAESIILVIIALFCLAFVLQVTIGIGKFIWKMAPYVVPLLVIAYVLAVTGNLNLDTETSTYDDARHIESVENQSGRGG